MKSFIKENASMVIALVLPLAFATFFLISKGAVHHSVEPPKHDFILTNTSRNNMFDITVIDNALRVQFKYPVLHNDRPANVNKPEIYYVNASTMVAEPIGIDLPADANNPAKEIQGTYITLNIEKFAGKSFNGAKISPDGFELLNKRYRDGNLMTEIFSAHRSEDRGLVLTKDGAHFDIRGLDRYYNLSVAGWVMQDNQ